MGQTLPLSLCMIVKNEEVFLDVALKSVKSVLGLKDMLVVDTGSTDSTKEIALMNGARVFDFEWCDDFSAARNFAAGNAENEWIFVLDADEEMISAEIAELADFIKNPSIVGSLTRIEMSDKANSCESRLYNRLNHRYEGSIHEQITPSDDRPKEISAVPVLIAHHGYLPEFGRVEGKLERNEILLKKELSMHPDDPYLLYQLGKSCFCNNRNLPLACDYFERALTADLDTRLVFVYNMVECYGYALVNTGQFDKAFDLMKKYAEYYIENPQFRFMSAHIYQNSGLLIEAVECYESCIGLDIVDYSGITSYLSYYNIGVILECVGMAEDAVRMYENCGDYAPALTRLAQMKKP